MLDELQRRNYALTTVQYYIQAVERFARHFHRPPDQLNQAHLREYQAYLLRERKLEPRTVKLHVLRFFFVKTLKRRYLLDDIPYPKVPRRLPTILLREDERELAGAILEGSKRRSDQAFGECLEGMDAHLSRMQQEEAAAGRADRAFERRASPDARTHRGVGRRPRRAATRITRPSLMGHFC
jgi:hypothetical protein